MILQLIMLQFGIEAAVVIPNEILSRYPGQNDYISPTTYVEAVLNHNANLPCNMTSPVSGDIPMLVLWYKSGIDRPVYSYDMRSALPTHWKSEKNPGNRATFDALKGDLIIQRTLEEDEGSYRCRVDFKLNPTLTYAVNLTVIIPPKRMWIISENGEEVSSNVGPYKDGDRVLLTCQITGGRPTPKVIWKEGNLLLDDVIERIRPQVVTNTLMIEKVTRKDLLRVLTCFARNTALIPPLQATVTIDMIFPPLEVHLTGKNIALSAGQRYKTECQVTGSRPVANVEFLMNDHPLRTHSITSNEGGNLTVATLLWTPTISDSDKKLVCRASSPSLDRILEDSTQLTVHYLPHVSLQPGLNLDLSNIEEGDDVYFDCRIKAVPPAHQVVWLLNDQILHHDVSQGIIMSNQSLVLQTIEKNASGKYACRATNSEGNTTSKTVQLQVKYAPVCRSSETVLHGAARHEQVHIPCSLDAHPMPSTFTWTFNNSGESVKIPEDHVKIDGFHSTVSYTPMTELDYGTLLCWGSNAVGTQKNPCVFLVFPAGRPDPVYNCSQFNLSDSSVNVRCSPGFDGGLLQTFVLELYDNHSSRLIANVTSPTAILSVSGLEPSTSFAAVVYSTNEKGSGELFRLQTYTLKDNAEKRTAAIKPAPSSNDKSKSSFSPLVLVVLGAVGGCLLVLFIILVAIRVRFQRLRAERAVDSHVAPTLESVNTLNSLAPIILKEPLRNSYEAEDINSDLIQHEDSSTVWRDSQVRTISTCSMIGSFATLPRKMSGAQGTPQSLSSKIPYAELGLSRASSLQSTCIGHGDPINYTSLENHRMSQPVIIPPPPPEFASSESYQRPVSAKEVQSVWQVRFEEKSSKVVGSHWTLGGSVKPSAREGFITGRCQDDEIKQSLLTGQQESSV